MGNFTPNWAGVLAFAIAIGLPIVVGLVTRWDTHSGVKALLLLLLQSLGQFLAQLAQPGGYSLKEAAWSAVVGFVIAVAAHYGLWKPTGVSDAATNALTGSASSRATVR